MSTCKSCKGTGLRSDEEVCDLCEGTGQVPDTTKGGEHVPPLNPARAEPVTATPATGSATTKVVRAPFLAQPEGIYIHVGTTGTGKTWLANEEIRATCAASGKNALIIDSTCASNFEDVPHAENLRDAILQTWGPRAEGEAPRVVVYTPENDVEFDALMKACREVGNVVLLVDELSFWTGSSEFKKLCRVWRHSRLHIYVTCQIVAQDLGQYILGCNPTLRIFRLSAPRSIEFMMRWHGLEPDAIRAHPDLHYFEKKF